ncbi:inositol monophosphatase [Pigmentiphaga sp. GD03639]|uniref:Inositol-1-monophosphatase n=1 Tax=Pigmentiphaga daeguensis TaxID=414049 RepID=A0ABP3M312_9BURK|nr:MULTISPECIES: inositol monophosphatase family protein [unclassified Pigmentiphaga]MDH2238388.1 inositol monophosphatase [Pigmentiphaga sp. GD03639]
MSIPAAATMDKPVPLDLFKALEAAVTAAHAGAAILQAYAHKRSELVIDLKARNDLVSQADREAEIAIIEVLRARTPQYGIVAEETGGSPSGPASWYIDPLDGTTNFVHAIPHYAVSIALVAQEGCGIAFEETRCEPGPVVGVIYDPCREEMFTSVRGVGAWLNSHRIQCSRTETLADALLATGFPYSDMSFTESYLPMLRDAMHGTRGVRRNGAAALDLAWVACGRFDGYWELRLKPWDVAAGTLLVREAGGQAFDPFGRAPWPEQGNIVAGGPGVAKALHDLIGPNLKAAGAG